MGKCVEVYGDWERSGDVCWGVGAGERKCGWRCVEVWGR